MNAPSLDELGNPFLFPPVFSLDTTLLGIVNFGTELSSFTKDDDTDTSSFHVSRSQRTNAGGTTRSKVKRMSGRRRESGGRRPVESVDDRLVE